MPVRHASPPKMNFPPIIVFIIPKESLKDKTAGGKNRISNGLAERRRNKSDFHKKI
jgi:hypothetical protein